MTIVKELYFDWFGVPLLLRTDTLAILLEKAYLRKLPRDSFADAWNTDVLWVQIHIAQDMVARDWHFVRARLLGEGFFIYMYCTAWTTAQCAKEALDEFPPVPALARYLDALQTKFKPRVAT